MAPKRQAHFNIAIRTALIDNASGVARYGAGGGVVWDSSPEEEHAELISKTQILSQVIAWGKFRAVRNYGVVPSDRAETP